MSGARLRISAGPGWVRLSAAELQERPLRGPTVPDRLRVCRRCGPRARTGRGRHPRCSGGAGRRVCGRSDLVDINEPKPPLRLPLGRSRQSRHETQRVSAMKMTMKQLIAGAALVGGLGVTAIGLGTGMATADPPPPWPAPGQPDQPPGPPQQGQDGDHGPGGPQGGRNQGLSGPYGGPGESDMAPPWQQGPPPPWQQGPPPPPLPGGPPPAPFQYFGQQVNPVFDQSRSAWGFWFLGTWIPL